MKVLILGATLAAGLAIVGSGVMADDGSWPVVTEIGKFDTTMSGQPIILPSGNVKVVASLYSIPPGQEIPVHRDQFPRYGYVLSGELSVTNEITRRTEFFEKGQFVTESIQQWLTSKNSGSLPLELLVIDQLPQTQ